MGKSVSKIDIRFRDGKENNGHIFVASHHFRPCFVYWLSRQKWEKINSGIVLSARLKKNLSKNSLSARGIGMECRLIRI